MTGRRRPPRYPGGGQRGFGDDAVLSEEEVQRRVNVEGGGQLQAPPPEHKFRDRRPSLPDRRRPRSGPGRDSLLLIGLAVAGLAAIAILLPKGPLTASSTNGPSQPGGSAAAVASGLPSTGPGATGQLITLPPGASSEATPPPVETAGPTTPVTPPPGPNGTPRPGTTPQPTVKPSKAPTPAPSQPATASLKVVVSVINGDGGASSAGAWTVTVNSGGTASPSSFPGSGSGTNVTLTAGASYQVTVEGPTGYATSRSADCASSTGGLPAAGGSETCTIVENDIAPHVTVTTVVNGGGPLGSPSDWTVSVSGQDASPSSFPGSSAGVTVRFDANTAYAITSEGVSGTDYTLSGTAACGGSGLPLGGSASCTFTYTYEPPPTETPGTGLVLPIGLLALARRPGGPRRWATSPRT